MAEKSLDDQVTEKRQELEELERKKNGQGFAEYPKSIVDPKDPSRSYVVQNAEQESAVKKGLGTSDHGGKGISVSNTFDLTPEEQQAKVNAKAEADKEAAKGQSRLGGPEDEKAAAKAVKDKERADKAAGKGK